MIVASPKLSALTSAAKSNSKLSYVKLPVATVASKAQLRLPIVKFDTPKSRSAAPKVPVCDEYVVLVAGKLVRSDLEGIYTVEVLKDKVRVLTDDPTACTMPLSKQKELYDRHGLAFLFGSAPEGLGLDLRSKFTRIIVAPTLQDYRDAGIAHLLLRNLVPSAKVFRNQLRLKDNSLYTPDFYRLLVGE
jgi:hypothetical protein